MLGSSRMAQGIVKQLVFCNVNERVKTSSVTRAQFMITAKSVQAAPTRVIGNKTELSRKECYVFSVNFLVHPECCGFCEG